MSSLSLPSPPETQINYRSLNEGLASLGYLQGKNLRFEWRSAEGRLERLNGLAEELVARKVDVIVANSTPAARAAQRATRTIPIVVISVGDPVGTGLVASLARPGGNITGMANLSVDIDPKRLEFLTSAVPGASRFAALLNSSNPTYPAHVASLMQAAGKARIDLVILEARSRSEIGPAFDAMAKAKVSGVLVHQDSLFNEHRLQVAQRAIAARLPAVFGSVEYAEAGGLMSYGASIHENFRHLATFIDRIFKGAKPADIPMEQPTEMEFVVNLQTAQAIGVKLPKDLLLRASRVIQ